jgi:hypothetical protein
MERFTVRPSDQIIVICRHKGEIIDKNRYFGYKSLNEIKNSFLACLPVEFRNTGKRIELTFFNVNRTLTKYIDTFS